MRCAGVPRVKMQVRQRRDGRSSRCLARKALAKQCYRAKARRAARRLLARCHATRRAAFDPCPPAGLIPPPMPGAGVRLSTLRRGVCRASPLSRPRVVISCCCCRYHYRLKQARTPSMLFVAIEQRDATFRLATYASDISVCTVILHHVFT